jgi:isoleucyl-tRNA synthetase
MAEEKSKKSPAALREEETLKFWEEHKIFEKSLKKHAPKGEFVFYEGPPTANGRPGIHHVEARAFKDIIPRFKTMQGFHVRRKAGWDTHGLPVELEVEKKIGSKSKKDIEKYGVAEFNKLCKESVWTYVDEWKKFTNRMGYWIDLEHPYVTYEPEYIESLWAIVKVINDKNLLYKDYRVVPWCARCGTALSSHELAQGYETVKDLSVYVKFELVDEPKTFVLAWTTTPWTLPGNVALAINNDIEYVKLGLLWKQKVKENVQEYIIISKDLYEKVVTDQKHPLRDAFGLEPVTSGSTEYEKDAIHANIPQPVKIYKGSELINLEYKPLYPYLKEHLPKSQADTLPKAYKIYPADFVTTADGTGIVHTAVMYGQDDFELGTKVGLPKYHLVDDSGHFTKDTDFLAGKFVKDEETTVDIIKDLAHRHLLFKKEKHEHSYPHCWRCHTPLIYYARDSWYVKMSALRDQLVAENKKINWQPDYIQEGRFGEWLREVKDWAFSRERYWGTPLPVWRCASCEKIEVIGSMAELEKKSGTLPKNDKGEIDLHKPYIDELTFACPDCKGTMKRVSEVIDVWFDSGAMPFAQDHYPFENKDLVEKHAYPADYISEAIDQTRGWFYTLHAVGVLMGKGRAYKNVICLGHILDKSGKKMSKSLGNTVNPWEMIDKYGVDVLRYWMYSINQPGESKNFDEKTVEEVVRKVPNLLQNVVSFYEMYASGISASNKSAHVLDQWILALLTELTHNVTKSLESFNVLEPARAIRDFIADLSQWYLRRSRDRFKGDDEADKHAALATTRFVLTELSKIMAPFMPFLAEDIFLRVKDGGEASVHLEQWPALDESNAQIIQDMITVRMIVSQALEARARANIKIRQPLQMLRINNALIANNPAYIDLIRDEVNVKEVDADPSITEVYLDTNISAELKAEGQARDFIRLVQELRKKEKLNPRDAVTLFVGTNDAGKALLEQFKTDITKTAQIGLMTYQDEGGEDLVIDDLSFRVTLKVSPKS